MNKTLSYLNNHYYFDLGMLFSLVAAIGLCFVLYIHMVDTKVAKPTCTDFTTYSQALQAFNAGNTGLDHNKNGYPCENLI